MVAHFRPLIAMPPPMFRKPVRWPLPKNLPLSRQTETFAREGIELDTSSLAGWIGIRTANLSLWWC